MELTIYENPGTKLEYLLVSLCALLVVASIPLALITRHYWFLTLIPIGILIPFLKDPSGSLFDKYSSHNFFSDKTVELHRSGIRIRGKKQCQLFPIEEMKHLNIYVLGYREETIHTYPDQFEKEKYEGHESYIKFYCYGEMHTIRFYLPDKDTKQKLLCHLRDSVAPYWSSGLLYVFKKANHNLQCIKIPNVIHIGEIIHDGYFNYPA